MISERARLNRLFRAEAKKQGFTVTSIRNNYCTVSDGERKLKFDISEGKYRYARSHSHDEAVLLVNRVTADFEVLDRMVSFTNGQNFLRFTAMHSGEVKKDMIAADFMGSLRMVLCTTSDDVHGRILDRKYLREWDRPAEVLFSVADRNMSRMLDKMALNEGTLDDKGELKYIEFGADNDFTAAMIMCSGFYDFAAKKLGKRFLVIAPSKDVIAAVTEPHEDISGRLADIVTESNRWSSEPLSTDVFLYTPKGAEIIKHFPEI